MSKKIIIKNEERESLPLRDYSNLKKRLLFGGVLLFAIIYIFIISYDFDKNTEEDENSEIIEQVVSEKEESEEVLEPVEGGTLRLSVTKFSTVNPYKNMENSMDQFFRLVYDSLFKYDENYNLVPELATGYSLSEDSKTLTITLNSAARWHDGSRVTAADVAHTINVIKNSPNSPYHSLVSNMAKTTARGNMVEIELGTANSLEAYKLVFPIIKNESSKTAAILTDGSFSVIGNGMFAVSKYEKGKSITLKRNDSYYGTKPHIDEIIVYIYADEEIRKNMFMANNVDIIDCSYYDLNKFDYDVFRTSSYQGRKFDFIAFNTGRAPFDQSTNRNAVARIFDMEAAIKDAYRGKIRLSLFPINNGSELNSVNKTVFDKDMQRKTKLVAFEPRRLRIVTDKDDPMKHRMAYILKGDLAKSGIDSDVEGLSLERLGEVIEAGNFDIGIFSYQVPLNKDITKLGSSNPKLFNYDFAAINQKMQEVYSAKSKYERSQKYTEVQNQLFKSMPYLGIGFRNEFKVYNQRIKGELKSTSIEIYNGIENIFIVEE